MLFFPHDDPISPAPSVTSSSAIAFGLEQETLSKIHVIYEGERSLG